MNERSLFLAALDLSDPAERSAYLDRACAGDAVLRAQVEQLLNAHQTSGPFMQRPAITGAAIVREPSWSERPGTSIGPYKLLEQIGEGGFGVVFLAEQTQPIRRKVALKVLKPGMDTRQVIARFEAERQALALMDHANIARVLDGGETAIGRPYFVMELVRGIPITDFCDRNRLSIRERLELFVNVCQAVQHAHQKGIIHRDIKPSNVMVTLHDITPSVKVIDFGIAKATDQQLTDKTLHTGLAQMIGTPMYMSPEQAGMSGLDVDTRSDIYSMGVLLYELLTGTTPFDKKKLREAEYDEIRRIIREEEPPRPSTRLSTLGQTAATVSSQRQSEPKRLSRLFRGELDWIVMKALEKDRNRRYQTANDFAADVQRYLHDEPVLARPPSARYRLRKFARRNKGRLAAAVLVLLFLSSLGGVVGWTAWDRAAQRKAFAADILRDLSEAQNFCRQDRLPEASAVLERARALATRRGVGEELARRVSQVRTDVDTAVRLEAIRLERAAVKDDNFNWQGAALRYPQEFRDYGLDLDQLDPAAAAAGIAVSAVRDQLIAALDDWLLATSRPIQERLLVVLDRVDADPWRSQIRIAFVKRNSKTLRELAQQSSTPTLTPAVAILLGAALDRFGEKALALEILRRAQQAHSGDFWLNLHLGESFMAMKSERAGEAAEYLRAALALRPDSPGILVNLGSLLSNRGDLSGAVAAYRKAVDLKSDYTGAHFNLGNALHEQGDLTGAVAAYRKVIALKPDYAIAYYNLGLALKDRGDLAGALAAYRKAIESKPDFAEAHCNLGHVLRDRGNLPAAVAAYRKAMALKPDLAEPHYNLGNDMRDRGDLAGAVAAYRKAIAFKSNFAEAHCNLGDVLRQQGEFAKALEELRCGHELGSKNPRWRFPSAQWVRSCERLLELDKRLPDFLAGKAAPANAAERIELAQLCALKQRNRAALIFYEEAFAAQPTLLEVHRYNAACAAALAGCNRGQDADQLNDKQRIRLRRQAMDWLRADLEAQGQLFDKQPAKVRPILIQQIQHWLDDSDFAGVRGPQALAKLPVAEREAWQKLWDDATALRDRAQRNPASEKR